MCKEESTYWLLLAPPSVKNKTCKLIEGKYSLLEVGDNTIAAVVLKVLMIKRRKEHHLTGVLFVFVL